MMGFYDVISKKEGIFCRTKDLNLDDYENHKKEEGKCFVVDLDKRKLGNTSLFCVSVGNHKKEEGKCFVVDLGTMISTWSSLNLSSSSHIWCRSPKETLHNIWERLGVSCVKWRHLGACQNISRQSLLYFVCLFCLLCFIVDWEKKKTWKTSLSYKYPLPDNREADLAAILLRRNIISHCTIQHVQYLSNKYLSGMIIWCNVLFAGFMSHNIISWTPKYVNQA